MRLPGNRSQVGGGYLGSAGHAVRQDTWLWHFPIFHLSVLSEYKWKGLFLLNDENLFGGTALIFLSLGTLYA